jgi:hypothetical protein
MSFITAVIVTYGFCALAFLFMLAMPKRRN